MPNYDPPQSYHPVAGRDTVPPAIAAFVERPPLLMLDIFAGLGGASQAMVARGWEVVTVDNEPLFGCTHTCDVRLFTWPGRRPDLVWLSPPCTEFSRESMPWCRRGQAPDLSLTRAALDLVRDINPRYWVLENVRGAVPWFAQLGLGAPRAIVGPFYLWGYFPLLPPRIPKGKGKESIPGRRPDLRAKVPGALSHALAVAVEAQVELWGEL